MQKIKKGNMFSIREPEKINWINGDEFLMIIPKR